MTTTTTPVDLDDPGRYGTIRERILTKLAIRRFYQRAYERFAETVARTPAMGIVLEIGSGAGFAKDVIPDLTTSDVLAYPGIDLVADATRLPFADGGLRAIFMLNVLHHIPDVVAFFDEAQRCLAPGGRMLIVDQHLGWISRPMLRWLHHEPYHPEAREWRFDSRGPLCDANGALAWIVFERDRDVFAERWPQLQVAAYRPHSALVYWLAGGLKSWSLVPGWACAAVESGDNALVRLSRRFASFVDIEIVKVDEHDSMRSVMSDRS